MAFAKAKLLRFNDVKSCVPPPGAYNPKFEKHVTGAIISSCERFAEKSPAGSIISETLSASSVKSVPCFRTPTLPRRKKVFPTPERNVKVNLFNQPKNEALTEKIVECMNKDQTIKDLENQIDEIKLEVNSLKLENAQLFAEKQDSLKSLEILKNEYDENVNKLKQEYHSNLNKETDNETLEKHFENFKQEFEINNSKLYEKLEIIKVSLLQNEEKLIKCEERCHYLQFNLSKKCEELDQLEKMYQDSLETQAQLQNNHAIEIQSLNKGHRTEVEDLEYEMLKIVTESNKTLETIEHEHENKIDEIESHRSNEVSSLQENFNKQINDLKADTDAHIRQIKENCSEKVKLSEIQMDESRKELESHWASKLRDQEQKSENILKECQAISEYTIIQSELEKNELRSNLNEFEKCVVQLKSEKQDVCIENSKLHKTIANLKTEMSNIIIELNEVREKLGNEIHAHQQNLLEKRGYEVALSKIHETVNALKNRLLNSDSDVEQLKEEIQILEKTTVDIEGRCYQLGEELSEVLEENDRLVSENNCILNLVEEKVNKVKCELINKIDVMNKDGEAKISELVVVLSEKEATIADIRKHMNEQQKLHFEAQALISSTKVEIEKLEVELTEQNFNIKRLESTISYLKKEKIEIVKENDAIKTELNTKNEQYLCLISELEEIKLSQQNASDVDMADICKKYIDQSGKYDALQQQYEEMIQKNMSLEKKVSEQDILIGPFRQHLINYENELNTLLMHKSEAEKEAREIGLKYAELMGHQNHKQKLKHLVDIKRKNIELAESKHECDMKILQQNRLIEKLRQEILTLTKQNRRSKSLVNSDKENVGSPGKTQILHSKVDSPVNPLKERN